MPPIPLKQPKSVKPLPLESTLGDLSSIRARRIDLSVLLDQSAKGTPSQSDEAHKGNAWRVYAQCYKRSRKDFPRGSE
ncbi:hypothetical protein OPQ81_007113 [Rhizoctonia solani]|nr:hypothetical protein OPQ81_007113 [Rhizoctonia solani]